jgi:hypothetical protein
MAASTPISASDMPAAAYTRGKRPQAIPSFRLFTSPAWLMDESSRSVKLVRRKTSRGLSACGSAAPARLASWATWCCVSRTASTERPSPNTTNPTPRTKGSGRSPYLEASQPVASAESATAK